MSTPCSLSQSYTPKACKEAGGVLEFYIANNEDVTAITQNGTTKIITAITMATGKKFWTYKQKPEAASFTDESAGSGVNGTVAWTQTALLDILGFDAATRKEIGALASATVKIIVKDNGGNYILLGQNYGMDLTTGAGQSGVAMGEFRGTKLTFTGKEPDYAPNVDSTIITALLSPAP